MSTRQCCQVTVALTVLLLAVSLSTGVQWQYEGESGESWQNLSSPSALAPPLSGEDAPPGAVDLTTNMSSSGLWSWGGAPRGFTVANGTLHYPADYYTSHFNTGSSRYPTRYNYSQNLSRYSTGFTTGYYAGINIMNILSPGEISSYDPWNNYPGYDPNYPHGYGSS